MSEPPQPASEPTAWQPLTFAGAARFGSASALRLSLVALITGLVAGAVILWFVALAWVPVVQTAMERLPETGAIDDGLLVWEQGTTRLAENRFLSIVVEPEEPFGSVGLASDVQIVLSATGLRFRSIFGYLPLPYPRGWIIALHGSEVRSWWGAWKPVVLAGLWAGTVLCLTVLWFLLGAVYCLPCRLLAWVMKRSIGLGGCWRVCVASLLPAALFLCGIFVLYGLQRISFVGLLIGLFLHFIIGWIYLLLATIHLPGLSQQTSSNPFSKGGKAGEKAK